MEYYYYDQLGSHYSDQPDDSSLWEVERFVDEVEQVRTALELGSDNFFLYGHSGGGLVALEYALAHQEQLKGLVISNMMASTPAYNTYAERALMPAMDHDALVEIKRLESAGRTDDPAYEALLMELSTSTTSVGCRSTSGPNRWFARSLTSTSRCTR